MKHFILSVLLVFTISLSVKAQETLPTPKNIQAAFDAGTRSSKGIPGKNYWQNHATYSIDVNFSPDSRLISGKEKITYSNNSPNSLSRIWFKLYPNYYMKGVNRDNQINPNDLSDGFNIEKVVVNGMQLSEKSWRISGTNMILSTDKLPSGKSMDLEISFNYTLNEGSHNRMGQVDKGSYFVAYFFPRITVYDDIDGWNRYPYTGSEEFYNDFSDFDVSITVPGKYVVWATGDLQNPDNVFHAKYIDRIAYAETHDEVIDVISQADLKQGKITLNNPTNTWNYTAQNVTDYVFATSDHYMWKSTSVEVDPKTKRRTRVDAAFNPEHKDYYEVVDFARKTVEAMSYDFPKWPFPYSHETVFDGLDQMEYPMMVNDNPLEDRVAAIELTDHEIMHTMFPFYMGTNETKYAWMDEGWATIGEWIISPIIDSTIVDEYGMKPYNFTAGDEVDLPITILSTQQTGTAYYLNSYPKPAMGYLYAKDALGEDFFKGLHYYIEHWNGKHPIPNDFFNAMNEGSGTNLNWFWEKWFYETGIPDLAIQKVKNAKNRQQVVVESVGNKPVPIDLQVMYKDGDSETIHRSILAWKDGNKTVVIDLPKGKKVKSIKLGSTYAADSNSKNNSYVAK